MTFMEAFKELKQGRKIRRNKEDSMAGYYVFIQYCGEPKCIGFNAQLLGTYPAFFLEEDFDATDWEIVE